MEKRRKGVRSRGKPREAAESEPTTQSAMEYLMTYGWAILVIAVVLGALFSLGVFNSGAFGQRAQPGSCTVVRPLGPYTTSGVGMLGECSGLVPEFMPAFAAFYSSAGANGNGNGRGIGGGSGGSADAAYVSLGSLPFDYRSYGFTATAWVYWFGPSDRCQGILGSAASPGSGFALFAYGTNNGACGPMWVNSSYLKWPEQGNYSIPQGRWLFVSAVYNQQNGTAALYIDMAPFSSKTKQNVSATSTNTFDIGAVGAPSGAAYVFNGLMTNVQVYDVPLSAAEMAAIYSGGMGGAPVDPQDLVAWWPLNGNANDYSGNGNNGKIVGALGFNSTWISSYPPG